MKIYTHWTKNDLTAWALIRLGGPNKIWRPSIDLCTLWKFFSLRPCHHPVNIVDKIEQIGDALFGTMHDLNLKTAKYFVLRDFNLDLINISSKNNVIQKYARIC